MSGTYPYDTTESDAIDRLGSFYNGNDYDAVTNAGGFGDGGHRQNFVPALEDVATSAGAIEAAAVYSNTKATAAASSATAAAASATSAAASAATLTGTSATSFTPAVGSQALTTQSGKSWSVGSKLVIASAANPTTNFGVGTVTAYSGTALTITFDKVGASPLAATDWNITLSGATGAIGATGIGSPGSTGSTGPGYAATSTTSLAIASSGSKAFTTQAGLAYSTGARVRATSTAAGDYMEGLVTSYSGTTLTITMDRASGSGTHTDWNLNLVGDVGATGAGTAGTAGTTGSAGGAITIPYIFDTTTTNSDPGNGKLRLSSATQNTSTAARLDLLDSNGATWTTVIDALDDSTNPTIKGQFRLFVVADPTKFIEGNISAVDSSTGYRNATISVTASSASSPFANTDAVMFCFTRAGDKGADGAGSGDTVGPASATDNAVARFDTTTGKLLQNSAVLLGDAGPMTPSANDGVALGSGTLAFSDLFLADGGVINFNNGNYTITHSAGVLTYNGALSIGTSNPFTAGTIELGNASDTTLSRISAGIAGVEGVALATISATQTLTNKRHSKRVTTVTQSATPTINTDNMDVASITGLAQAITSFTTNLTGTPVDGDLLLIRVTDNGTARAITWGASFESSTVTLPTTTVISTMLSVLLMWNTATSKWRCVGVA